MSAPEQINLNRGDDGELTAIDIAKITSPLEAVGYPYDCVDYIRQDIHEATLAERDATIAELRAALNEAAQGYENLVAIGVLPIAYEEAVQELSNKYRAIAEDTK